MSCDAEPAATRCRLRTRPDDLRPIRYDDRSKRRRILARLADGPRMTPFLVDPWMVDVHAFPRHADLRARLNYAVRRRPVEALLLS